MEATASNILQIIILAGLLSIVYGYFTGKNILSSSAGSSKMQEIASAIQIGAKAYLNRQYKTIAIVLYCRLRYAFAPICIADAISCILLLPALDAKIFLPVKKP